MDLSQPAAGLATLLSRARQGDEEALTSLLQHYEPRIRTAAHVLLGTLLRPHLDSLDLVQSVHCVLLPALRDGKYDVSNLDDLIALAVTVVRRKVARSWRRIRREHDLQAQARAQGTANASASPDPAESALRNDLLGHLLNQLDASDRRLVELRIQGHSTAEIAAQMDCEPHALRARLSRLRRRLRNLGYTDWL